MRIVHVVLSLDVGGQETMIVHLARGLQRRGHDVSVTTFTEGGTLRGELAGIPITTIARRGGVEPDLVLRVFRSLRTMRADVVHTHNMAPLVYAAPAARLARVGCVVHTKHGAAAYSRGSRALARAGARAVDAFVAVSDKTASVAARDEAPRASRLRVIPNGIPLGAYASDRETRARVRRELGVAPDAFVIGTVGRMVAEKDHAVLVSAVAPIVGPNVRCVVVGDGPLRQATEAAVPAPARPFFAFLGLRHDVPALLQAFDIFVLSSKTEGLPLGVLEAFAAGLPVVSTRVGGLPDVVRSDVGLLVPPGDPPALRDAIRTLETDAARREAMAKAASAYVRERYSLDAMVDAYEALYRTASRRGQGSSR